MRKYSSRSRESLASSRTSAAMLPPPFRRHSRHGNGAAPLCKPAGRSGVSRGATGEEQRARGQRAHCGAGAVRDCKHGAGCGRARATVRTERGRGEMVAAAFLPEPRPLPGSHHGGLRSSAGGPRPPRPVLAASPRPPWRLPSAQSLRSGASLPGERPGQAPGSCSGSPSPTRPELRRRGRAGEAGPRAAGPPLGWEGMRRRSAVVVPGMGLSTTTGVARARPVSSLSGVLFFTVVRLPTASPLDVGC